MICFKHRAFLSTLYIFFLVAIFKMTPQKNIFDSPKRRKSEIERRKKNDCLQDFFPDIRSLLQNSFANSNKETILFFSFLFYNKKVVTSQP